MKMNTPNLLTILRVLLVPVFYLFFAAESLDWGRTAALLIFIAASLTDFLDGYLARKNHEITNFGKFMDPLADKLLVTTALLCFTAAGQLPAWVTAIVVGRDLAVDGLRMLAASQGTVMAAGWSGKVKTAVTMVSICVMIVFYETDWVNAVGAALILILNLVSLVDYFWRNGGVLRDENS